jgi:predicted transcriptional regulator
VANAYQLCIRLCILTSIQFEKERHTVSKMIRMDDKLYAKLDELSKSTKLSKKEVLSRALERLGRELLLQEANKAYESMRTNKRFWKEELKERALWDATLMDGLEDD